jgi:hypothetical protein
MHNVEPNDPSGYRASSKASSIHNQAVILHVRAITVADQVRAAVIGHIFHSFTDVVVLRIHGARLCKIQ